jgi:hypothetical protein
MALLINYSLTWLSTLLYSFLIFHENCLLTYIPLQLLQAIEYNNITADNVYNWDEKGFLIRVIRAIKRIMSKEAYKSGRVIQAAHNGNREFITCLVYISAIGKRVPATLLYTSGSFDLRNTWVQDLQE